jgi:muramoyltetrapeptide carboxypeptidase
MNKAGIAEGVLVGGNLKTIETLTGSRSDLDTAGKILFVEDTGEYLYSVDRMFWNLKRSGKLSRLKALVIGGFKLKPDNPGEEFGGTLYDLVLDKVSEYDYPVCFDFPVGHQKENYALKCGVKHSLDVNSSGVTLREV